MKADKREWRDNQWNEW